jgi:hypothetical protein
LGQGGYFSPQFYGLASAPVTWYDRNEHVEYEIAAAVGVQRIVEDPSPFFPMMLSQPIYQGQTRMDANYNVSFRLEGRLASHVMLGLFANANNARDYSAQAFGVTLKILADRVPANTGLHIKSVPDWRGRQPFSIY